MIRDSPDAAILTQGDENMNKTHRNIIYGQHQHTNRGSDVAAAVLVPEHCNLQFTEYWNEGVTGSNIKKVSHADFFQLNHPSFFIHSFI